jgi:hypothetical protein
MQQISGPIRKFFYCIHNQAFVGVGPTAMHSLLDEDYQRGD